jgi:Secretion system C-terminal sorting domain
VLRLYGEDIPDSVKPTPLTSSKYAISPNPAVEYTTVNLELATQNKSVTVSIIDLQGRIVASQVVRNFQSGQTKIDTRNLASGNYGIIIRSSEEGAVMKNLMICH